VSDERALAIALMRAGWAANETPAERARVEASIAAGAPNAAVGSLYVEQARELLAFAEARTDLDAGNLVHALQTIAIEYGRT
jgi:hypothetical protein